MPEHDRQPGELYRADQILADARIRLAHDEAAGIAAAFEAAVAATPGLLRPRMIPSFPARGA